MNTKNVKPSSRGSKSTKARRYDNNKECTQSMKPVSATGTNHDSFWNYNPELLNSAANINFSYVLGTGFDLSARSTNFQFPTLMVLEYVKGPGVADSPTSVINVAAKNIYSYVRHANSGSKVYDSPDLMLYLLGMDEVLGYLAWMRRVYGLAMTYLTRNRKFPDQLLSAMGLDPDSVRANLARFRTYIDTYTARASALKVPKLPLYERHVQMDSFVYADSPDVEKAQLYMFNPTGFRRYVEDEGPGHLQFMTIGELGGQTSGALNIDHLIIAGNNLLDSFLTSEDIGIMSGDILKAYQSDVFTLSFMDPSYTCYPVYDPMMLDAIQNSTWMGFPKIDASGTSDYIFGDNLNISHTSDLGNLQFNPSIVATEGSTAANIINSDTFNPDPMWVMKATRLHAVSNYDLAGDRKYYAFGSEFITNVRVYYASSYYSIGSSVDQFTTLEVARISAFHKHPLLYLTSSQNPEVVQSIAGNVTNYARVGNVPIKALHDVAMLSLLNVPIKK